MHRVERDSRKSKVEGALKVGEVYVSGETIILGIGRKEYQFNGNFFDHILDQMTECIVLNGPDNEGC